jgi:hypothetical protein
MDTLSQKKVPLICEFILFIIIKKKYLYNLYYLNIINLFLQGVGFPIKHRL